MRRVKRIAFLLLAAIAVLMAFLIRRWPIDPPEYNSLIEAARGGSVKDVEYWLRHTKTPDVRSEPDQETALHVAAYEGVPEVVQLLLDHGVAVNATDAGGFTPLWYAACATEDEESNQHEECMARLLAAGADPNLFGGAKEEEIQHLVALVASLGRARAVRMLIASGADVKTPEPSGMTALHYACVSGDSETVSTVIKAGADVDAKSRNDTTPLHSVAKTGAAEVAQVLIDAGADINARGVLNKTPLYVAAQRGHADVVEILLAAGADQHIATTADDHGSLGGKTPLHRAASEGLPEIVQLLLEREAPVNSLDDRGYTPLWSAACATDKDSREHEACMVWLLAGGVNPNAKEGSENEERRWRSLLALLASAGKAGAVRVMIAGGADTELREENGMAALHTASLCGDAETVSILIDAGADVNAKCADDRTPLHVAARSGAAEVAEMLIHAGADVNAKGPSSMTPLFVAAHEGRAGVVEVLLAAGADPEVSTDHGSTPLGIARRNNHGDAVRVLKGKLAEHRE